LLILEFAQNRSTKLVWSGIRKFHHNKKQTKMCLLASAVALSTGKIIQNIFGVFQRGENLL